MDTGELDIYALTREQLEAAAALFAPAVSSLRCMQRLWSSIADQLMDRAQLAPSPRQ